MKEFASNCCKTGEEVTPQLLETITAVLNQAQAGEDDNLVEAMRSIHRQVLRVSMQANIQNP